MPQLEGKMLNQRYQVESLIGRGGMAEVYKAWDQQRAVFLALKLLREDLSEDKVFLRRFKREAQTLARLQHPSIVRFYGLEQDGPLAFMLMDFIEGTSLRREIFEANEPLASQRVLEMMRPVCAALHYAHSLGFVHCDIKPGNILIDNSGRVLLTDFGIARMSESATATMVGVGTPAYMAPEQVRGEDPTPQTDIYALGVVLYEMLTGGERPFTGERARTTGSTSEKVRWEQLHLDPPFPRKYNPQITPELEAVVMTCLDKEPVKRLRSVMELLTVLEQAIAHANQPLAAAKPPHTAEEKKGKPRRELSPPEGSDRQAEAEAHLPRIERLSSSPSGRRQKRLVWVLGGLAIVITLLGWFVIQRTSFSNTLIQKPTESWWKGFVKSSMTATAPLVMPSDDLELAIDDSLNPAKAGLPTQIPPVAGSSRTCRYRVKRNDTIEQIIFNLEVTNVLTDRDQVFKAIKCADTPTNNCGFDPNQPDLLKIGWILDFPNVLAERCLEIGGYPLWNAQFFEGANSTQNSTSSPGVQSSPILSTTAQITYREGVLLFEDGFQDGVADKWDFRGTEKNWEVIQDEPGNYVLHAFDGGVHGTSIAIIGSPTWRNYALEFRGKILESPDIPLQNEELAAMVRLQSDFPGCDESYRIGLSRTWVFLGKSYGSDCFFKFMGSRDNEIDLDQNVWYEIRIEVYEYVIFVYIDGNRIINATDPNPILAGQLGIYSKSWDSVYFDDVRVVELIPSK